MTIDIGGNDVIAPHGGGVPAIEANLPVILAELREAAGTRRADRRHELLQPGPGRVVRRARRACRATSTPLALSTTCSRPSMRRRATRSPTSKRPSPPPIRRSSTASLSTSRASAPGPGCAQRRRTDRTSTPTTPATPRSQARSRWRWPEAKGARHEDSPVLSWRSRSLPWAQSRPRRGGASSPRHRTGPDAVAIAGFLTFLAWVFAASVTLMAEANPRPRAMPDAGGDARSSRRPRQTEGSIGLAHARLRAATVNAIPPVERAHVGSPHPRLRRRPARSAACLGLSAPAASGTGRHALRHASGGSPLPLDRGVDRRPDLGPRPEPSTRLGLHGHDQRAHRSAARALRRRASRHQPAASALAARNRNTRARARGLPPAAMDLAARRGEGRMPGDPPLHRRRPATRRLPPSSRTTCFPSRSPHTRA